MPTEKQIQTSRANGARSKGPKTAPGKLNSSRNSARHGLLAQTVVLETESVKRFLQLQASLMAEFQPSSTVQKLLVETMAAARWRLWRVWGIQSSALDRDIALQDSSVGPPCVRAIASFCRSGPCRSGPGYEDNSNPAELLLRYEIALDRQFTRALNRLLTLQSSALQSQPAPREPAPYQPDSPGGRTFDDPDQSEMDDPDQPDPDQPENDAELPPSEAVPPQPAEGSRDKTRTPTISPLRHEPRKSLSLKHHIPAAPSFWKRPARRTSPDPATRSARARFRLIFYQKTILRRDGSGCGIHEVAPP